jgi:hypothetical protein
MGVYAEVVAGGEIAVGDALLRGQGRDGPPDASLTGQTSSCSAEISRLV